MKAIKLLFAVIFCLKFVNVNARFNIKGKMKRFGNIILSKPYRLSLTTLTCEGWYYYQWIETLDNDNKF